MFPVDSPLRIEVIALDNELRPTFVLKRGDTAPALRVRVVDAAGEAIDLTGTEVTLQATCLALGRHLERAATIADPGTGGIAAYAWLASDWAEGEFAPGTWLAEIQIAAGVALQSAPTAGHFLIVVEEDLG